MGVRETYLLPFQVEAIEDAISAVLESDRKVKYEHTHSGDDLYGVTLMKELTEGVDTAYLSRIRLHQKAYQRLNDALCGAHIIREYSENLIHYGTLFQATIAHPTQTGVEVDTDWYLLLNTIEGLESLDEDVRNSCITDQSALGSSVFGLVLGQQFSFQNPMGQTVMGTIVNIATEKEAEAFLKGSFPEKGQAYVK